MILQWRSIDMRKKFSFFYIVFIFLLFLLPQSEIHAEQNSHKTIFPLTVESYKQWLSTTEIPKVEISTLNADKVLPGLFGLQAESLKALKSYTTDGVYTSEVPKDEISSLNLADNETNGKLNNAVVLTAFNSLSDESQELFISYLNDEELMKKVMRALIKGTDNVLADGNITISLSMSSISIAVPGTRNTNQKCVTAVRTAYYMGAVFARASNFVVFDHDTVDITNFVGVGFTAVVADSLISSISGTTIAEGINDDRAIHVVDVDYQIWNSTTYERWGVWGNAISQGEW